MRLPNDRTLHLRAKTLASWCEALRFTVMHDEERADVLDEIADRAEELATLARKLIAENAMLAEEVRS